MRQTSTVAKRPIPLSPQTHSTTAAGGGVKCNCGGASEASVAREEDSAGKDGEAMVSKDDCQYDVDVDRVTGSIVDDDDDADKKCGSIIVDDDNVDDDNDDDFNADGRKIDDGDADDNHDDASDESD